MLVIKKRFPYTMTSVYIATGIVVFMSTIAFLRLINMSETRGTVSYSNSQTRPVESNQNSQSTSSTPESSSSSQASPVASNERRTTTSGVAASQLQPSQSSNSEQLPMTLPVVTEPSVPSPEPTTPADQTPADQPDNPSILDPILNSVGNILDIAL